METSWKSPNIIIGQVATGNYYFVREDLENEIWEEIKKGNNILLTAPRRVGKTSVMKSLAEQSNADYKLVFKNIQGIKEEAEYYKMLYELILTCLRKSKRYLSQFGNYFKTIGITEITKDGIKIERRDIDYRAEINQLIPQLKNENIILLIDELPEVLYNLYKRGKGEDALNILNNLREWRQQNGFEKVRFVLAGSIGIHYVVNKIDKRPKDINDFNEKHCQPLDDKKGEFEKYMTWVTKDATIQYDENLTTYLKQKINYLAPFFINLLLEEIDRECRSNNQRSITQDDIDRAFPRAITKNINQFSDWKKRLQDYLSEEDFDFVNEILIQAAYNDGISIQEIHNVALLNDKKNSYMEFIRDLERDGYIVKQNEKYVFISPFLKEFWKNDNPVYNG